MFKSKKAKPLSFFDAVINVIPPKKTSSHRLRNGLIVTGVAVGSALVAAAAKKGGDV